MDISSHLQVFGVDHQRAPVAIREQISFSGSKLKAALHHLINFDGMEGGIILSTCNRSEIYVSTHSFLYTLEKIKQFLTDFRKVDLEDLSPYFYFLKNMDAAEHLFRVSSGLESQVLGENEILGQVKRAYFAAKAAGATDTTMEKIFESAIQTGKKVRKETNINKGSTSLSGIAVKLAEKKFRLQGKRILLVGVNKINEQIARYLYERSIQTVIVANRTYKKAVKLAHYLGGRAVHFDQFKEELNQVDIIISSTAAPHLILKKKEVEAALKKRGKELLLIDMAVPRDIDPEIKELKGVTLYDLDDFNQVIRENLGKKRDEALKAECLIKQALKRMNFQVNPLTVPYQLNESAI